jgi:hypothetical protein
LLKFQLEPSQAEIVFDQGLAEDREKKKEKQGSHPAPAGMSAEAVSCSKLKGFFLLCAVVSLLLLYQLSAGSNQVVTPIPLDPDAPVDRIVSDAPVVHSEAPVVVALSEAPVATDAPAGTDAPVVPVTTVVPAASPSFCIVFVIESGQLELKGMLLAYSLRQNFRSANPIDIVAAVPARPRSIGDDTRDLLSLLGVRCVSIEMPISGYGYSNKMAAMGVATKAKYTIFFDSDILILKPVVLDDVFAHDFTAKLTDTKQNIHWTAAYGLFNLKPPSKLLLSTVTKQRMVPWYNAGLVAVENGPEFAKVWIDVGIKLEKSPKIPRSSRRPWLDQTSLPIAVALTHKRDVKLLDHHFNFPAHILKLPVNNTPAICHYHYPRIISREKVLLEVAQKFFNTFLPAYRLAAKLGGDWAKIIKSISLPNEAAKKKNKKKTGKKKVGKQKKKTGNKIGKKKKDKRKQDQQPAKKKKGMLRLLQQKLAQRKRNRKE